MAYLDEVLADSPSAYFRLGESSGTSAADKIGGTAGTYKGGFTLGQAALASGEDTAVTFNGTTGYVLLADRPEVDLADTFTLEAWIRFDEGGKRNTIFAKGSGAYVLRVHEDNKILFGRDGFAVLAKSSIALEPGVAYHVVATKSGSTRKIYVNGVDVTELETNSTCADNATDLSIGAYAAGAEHFFDGTLDEVAVYKTALSTERVEVHHLAGVKPGGALLFSGDEKDDFDKVEGVGEITQVADPAGGLGMVMALTTPDSSGEEDPPRIQALSPSYISDGDEVWLRTKLLIPADYPAREEGWVRILSIYGSPFTGSAPFGLSYTPEGKLAWQRNETYAFDVPWVADIAKGDWVDVLVHYKHSAEGWVEMWVDGEQATFDFAEYNPNEEAPTAKLEMVTKDPAANGTGLNHAKILNYHQASIFGGEDTTINFDWLKLGTTEAAVSPPFNTVAPAITGTAAVSKTLECSTGTWDWEPESHAYQWQRSATGKDGWSSIGAATTSTYKITDADKGEFIRCIVTATNEAGSGEAASAASTEIEPGPGLYVQVEGELVAL